ncbi:FG-GAP-like repeat-containing protein [Pseudoalteromonas haloplanktis]|uniref:FG-GAP-like repeat-containing protein n=1 Tax=Pseudoalteromonas haloplanktis TaxID=228 RepID=A0ABU1B7N5_PSEHA|nr:FG-GAP-like repeat-containing protein [Pseudoalteromonas haloplanktis]MDQ9090341.1 FG-GAP-like repeat-containing protein [Pseudoalteromonas haloplanktis]
MTEKWTPNLLLLMGIACFSTLTGCQSNTVKMHNSGPAMFSEVNDVIPFESLSRRKWDNALLNDFDKDGFLDVLITEHTHAVKIFWNNGEGSFSSPQVVIRGDTHGVAAADYDLDGRVDLIIAQGGGGGTKPRLPVSFQINHDRTIEGGSTFSGFERTRGRAVKLIDSNNNGTLDLVLSAFPLSRQKQGANHLYQNLNGNQFKFIDYLPNAKWLGYKTLVTDFNNDNKDDIVFYGGANMVAVLAQPGLNYRNATNQVFGELKNTSHVSSITEIDYDNDGDNDLLLTRAKHQFERQTFYSHDDKQFAFFARNEQFVLEDLNISGDFEIENLQMAYPHFDVFVGENKQPLMLTGHGGSERKIKLTPEQARGWPTKLDKKGLYIGYLGEGIWRLGGDINSPAAGVIKRVTKAPKVTDIEPLPVMLLENQHGHFIDATAKLGIDVTEPTTSAVAGDFNNDGWIDLFLLRYGNPAMQNEQLLFLNKQGQSFVAQANHGVISRELGATGGSVEKFDYDNDGDLDLIYSNERGRWHLFKNQLKHDAQHNFVVFNIGYSLNKQAASLGAVLKVNACGQTYQQKVGGSSSPFSISENNRLHIGLGNCTDISSASVRWSNAEQLNIVVKELNNPEGLWVGSK